jgi:hypothetical protein
MVRGCPACERALRKKEADDLKSKKLEAKKLKQKEHQAFKTLMENCEDYEKQDLNPYFDIA